MKHLFTSYYNDKGMYVIYNEETANADSVIEYVVVMLEQFINTLAEESDETIENVIAIVGKDFNDFVKLGNNAQNNIDSVTLGLIIAKRLVTMLGGDIKFINEPGMGTQYHILIKQKIINSKKILLSKVVPVLREKAGDKNIDIHQIEKVVRNTIKSIVYPEINYTSTFPKELDKGGKLEGSEAEEFIESANNYISNFQTIVKENVKMISMSMWKDLFDQNEAIKKIFIENEVTS